jgi:purine-binding chemotaxis protein CheW
MYRKLLKFRLAGEWYLIDVGNVLEIFHYRDPTSVPGSVDEILGILNIRGKIVPILSGSSLFHLSASTKPNDEKIIILETNTADFGIVVDDVSEILELEDDVIEYATESTKSQNITGTVNHDNQTMILVDFSSINEITGKH